MVEPLRQHFLFGLDRPEQVSPGALLDQAEIDSIMTPLREFVDVFDWSHKDMPAVFPDMAHHRLSVQEDCKLITTTKNKNNDT